MTAMEQGDVPADGEEGEVEEEGGSVGVEVAERRWGSIE